MKRRDRRDDGGGGSVASADAAVAGHCAVIQLRHEAGWRCCCRVSQRNSGVARFDVGAAAARHSGCAAAGEHILQGGSTSGDQVCFKRAEGISQVALRASRVFRLF